MPLTDRIGPAAPILIGGLPWAQAPGAPGVPSVNFEGTKATYRATVTGLVTVTGATDIAILPGSATKTVRVTRVVVSGTIQTAAQHLNIALVKRSAANTGGASSAMTRVPMDSSSAAATTAPLSYTGNPTPGAAVGTIEAQRYFAALEGGLPAGLLSSPAVFEFGTRNSQAVVLRGVAQGLAVNLNAPANAGVFDVSFEFTEE